MSDSKKTTDESLDKVSGGASTNTNISDLNNPNNTDDFKNPMLIRPFDTDEKESGRRKIDSFKNPMLTNPNNMVVERSNPDSINRKTKTSSFNKPF